jgi:putative transposase
MWFYTLRLQGPHRAFLVDHVQVLRNAVSLCRARWPMDVDAAVILPDRLHMIWTLPRVDADGAKRWRLIKSAFARNLPVAQTVRIWQRGYFEHEIRDHADLILHRHLIHTAPIQAGLVRNPRDWPYSSFGKWAGRTGERVQDSVAIARPA